MSHENPQGRDLDRLRELIDIAQARAGWCDEWTVELNVLACRLGPDLLRVVEASKRLLDRMTDEHRELASETKDGPLLDRRPDLRAALERLGVQ